MKAVIIGTGRIGCGFAGQLLRASRWEVVFVGRNAAMIRCLNRAHGYRVRLVEGTARQEIEVNHVRAVGNTPDQAISEISSADLLITAVGVGNLPDVAPLIAAGLRDRCQPVNILAFENLSNAGEYLRKLVATHLPADCSIRMHGFSGVLVSRAVTRRLGDPSRGEGVTFLGDPLATFVVDGHQLRKPLPQIEAMIVADNYEAWIHRKLYIFSAGHATTAYLGYLKGYHYIHTAICDPEIRQAVLAAMAEGQRGLALRYGSDIAGDENDLLQIIDRFANAALNDPIMRVARDPRRKLNADDRLVGAARLAAKAGVTPENLSLATAAAFCFYNHFDPCAGALQAQMAGNGRGPAVCQVAGLDPQNKICGFLNNACERLTQGRRKGDRLLSLRALQWA